MWPMQSSSSSLSYFNPIWFSNYFFVLMDPLYGYFLGILTFLGIQHSWGPREGGWAGLMVMFSLKWSYEVLGQECWIGPHRIRLQIGLSWYSSHTNNVIKTVFLELIQLRWYFYSYWGDTYNLIILIIWFRRVSPQPSAYVESSNSHSSHLVPSSLCLGIWGFVCISKLNEVCPHDNRPFNN